MCQKGFLGFLKPEKTSFMISRSFYKPAKLTRQVSYHYKFSGKPPNRSNLEKPNSLMALLDRIRQSMPIMEVRGISFYSWEHEVAQLCLVGHAVKAKKSKKVTTRRHDNVNICLKGTFWTRNWK